MRRRSGGGSKASKPSSEATRAGLESAFRSAPSFLAVLRGPQFVVELVNEAYCRMVGRGEAELLGSPVFDVIPEARGQGFEALLESVLRTGEVVTLRDVPVLLRRTPGDKPETVYHDLTYLPLLDDEGRRVGVIAHGTDVTEHVLARREVDRLLTAERQAHERTERLQAVTAALSRALTPDAVVQAVLGEVVPEFHARAGGILAFVEQDGETPLFRYLGGIGFSAKTAEEFREFPADAPLPVRDVWQTQQGVFLEDYAAWVARYPLGPRETRPGHPAEGGAWAALPLCVGDRLIGAITLSFPEARQFIPEDRAFMIAVARQCAQALERAWLFDTERAARQAAEYAEERARLLFERSPIPKLLYDLDTLRFLEVNNAALKLYGWPRDEFLRRGLPDVRPPGEQEQGLTPRPGTVTRLNRRADGAIIEVEVTTTFVAWRGRRAALAAVVDVTERNQAERALRESEDRFRTLADTIPQLAWMADAAGSMFWYNQRWYDYTGTTLETVRGWGWRAVHHPDHVQRVVERIQRSWDTGEVWEDTFPLRGRTGEYRWFLSRALPIRDDSGAIVRWFGTSTDITQQLQTEAALRLAKEEAEDANRAKSEFLAAMSHELRTPLNAIGGYVELLQLGIHGPVSERQLKSLERIRINGQHLLTLITDILSYAKIEAGRITYELRELSTAIALADVRYLVLPQIQAKGLSFEVEAGDPSLAVLGDIDRVRQILLNLVGNAIKFTDPGDSINVFCDGDGRWVRVAVRDTGHGIPPDRLERIFEPFVQLERHRFQSSQQGVGLGLAISRDLARGMGGDIVVESTLGVGSTFTLLLPRSQAGVDALLASGERRRGRKRPPGKERRAG